MAVLESDSFESDSSMNSYSSEEQSQNVDGDLVFNKDLVEEEVKEPIKNGIKLQN